MIIPIILKSNRKTNGQVQFNTRLQSQISLDFPLLLRFKTYLHITMTSQRQYINIKSQFTVLILLHLIMIIISRGEVEYLFFFLCPKHYSIALWHLRKTDIIAPYFLGYGMSLTFIPALNQNGDENEWDASARVGCQEIVEEWGRAAVRLLSKHQHAWINIVGMQLIWGGIIVGDLLWSSLEGCNGTRKGITHRLDAGN